MNTVQELMTPDPLTVHAENQVLLRFIERSGLYYSRRIEHGICELQIELVFPAKIAQIQASH